MCETSSNSESIPTFVAFPVDSFQNNPSEKPEKFRVIKNAIIKTLSDGSLCIIDANDLNESSQEQQIEITYLPSLDNSQPQNIKIDKPQIITNIHNAPSLPPLPPQKPPNPLYKCPKCKEVFDRVVNYRKHMVWHRNCKKFKCDKCSAGYNVETNLKIHMAMHTEGKPTCPICSITFQRLASLKSHLMLHQVEEMFTCEECGAEFEKEEEVNKHLQSHLNRSNTHDNNLICSYCNVQFDDRKNYKEHVSHHVKVKQMVLSGKKSRKTNSNKNHPHVCSVCLKSFSKLSLLERHLRIHSGERPFICEHCNKGFNQKGTLQIHLSKHTGIKPFHCTLCSAKFNQKGNLRVHVEKTHTAPLPGVKMYKCPHCTCIFKKIASLNVHITKCHANVEEINDIANVLQRLKDLEEQTTASTERQEKEVVEQNLKVLNEVKKNDVASTNYVRLAESFLDGTIRRYLVMQKKVNDVKWYICSYCNKEFKKPSDLIRHTRVHTREKPFSCKQCGASFALKSTLFYHVKTHTGNNNFFCSICAKQFSSVRSVNMHSRKHIEKPQYKCLSCNKSFSSIQKAKFHNKEFHSPNEKSPSVELKQPLVETSHGLLPVAPPKQRNSSPKQFQCPICNAKFTKTPNLKRHMLLHNGERKFKCDQCSKCYFHAHALKEHALYHSGVRNFGCKSCGKRFMTSSLLKRHMITHSTNRPYVCPYCNKNFKSLVMCKKHMNVHKKDVGLQVRALNETDEIDDLSESDKVKVTTNDEHILNSTRSNDLQIISQELPQELYEITPNTIQIITDSSKDISQIDDAANEVQTIFINCEDLQLPENLYPQNATDTFLFNTLNDLNIDPLNNEMGYNTTNQIVNMEEHPSNNAISISELTNKVLKLKTKNTVTNNVVPYYSQPELNLLFNLDTEFAPNNSDLVPNDNLNMADINLNAVSVLNVEPISENMAETPDQEGEKEEGRGAGGGEEKNTCGKCKKTFNHKKLYLKHVQSHETSKNGSGGHKCSFCLKIFKKHSDLIRHIRTHTGERPFPCDKCEKKFSLKSSLLSHQRTHNPVSQKQYSCVVCNSFFSWKSSLKVHMTVHTGDKPHKCDFCPMKFRTAAHRKSHENSHHINPSKKRKNKVTSLLASVAMDVLNQQESNQIVANDLENVLIVQEPQIPNDQQLSLLNETNINNDTQQLEPLILQQLQSNLLLQDNFLPSLIQLDNGTLLNVKSTTTAAATAATQDEAAVARDKPRNLECDVCHKKYASKDVLRKHRKIHNKKHKCTKCEKGFDNEDDLQTHEKTHDGFRPFSCLYCANSFTKEQSLTIHMKRIHNIPSKDTVFM